MTIDSGPITIASSTRVIDGAEIILTIYNASGNDLVVVNFNSSFSYAGWSVPVAGRHRSMAFVYDGNYNYWTATSVGQFDIANA